MKLQSVILLALSAFVGSAWAHGGGLNKDGCHSDRKNGGYHCHRSSSAGPAAKPNVPANQLAPAGYAAPSRPHSGRAFANCDEARAAGAAPVRRGQPGYGPHLDRDNDGVGCEPYKGR